MARILTKTKSTRGKPYQCLACHKPIVASQKYYEWTPFRSFSRRKHVDCGYPKRSETDTSKMSSVYAAIEGAEAQIGTMDDPSDIANLLSEVASTASEIATEYQDAVDALGGAGEGSTSAERASALESYAEALESKASDLESEEFEGEDESDSAADATNEEDEKDEKNEEGEGRDEWIQRLRDEAQDTLNELEV